MGKAAAWLRHVLMLCAFLCALMAATWWLGNRSVSSPSLAERQARLDRAANWILANEAQLRDDRNMPLWHMVQWSAELAHRDDLRAMVERVMATFEPVGGPQSPWVRFVKPDADITLENFDFDALYPDQKAFFSALTCGAFDQLRELPDDWRHRNTCRPALITGFVDGGVCSTHQLMALMALHRRRCQNMPWDTSLLPSLQEDIRIQMAVDPLFRDRYVQRVLMMWWTSGEQALPPIWLRRVMDAQHPDGRWSWSTQLPELPQSWQPWALWDRAASHWPRWVPKRVGAGDFHTTAQGLLLMALSVQSAQGQQAISQHADLSPSH